MQNSKSFYLLFVLFFTFRLVAAQADLTDEKIKIKMWGDPDFNTTELPEKWKSESAVILAKSYEYEVKKEVFLDYIYENQYFHKRVKLLDKSVINDFSELTFEKDNDNMEATFMGVKQKDVSIGIKVIKPNGKENIVDLKEVVVKEIKEGDNKIEYQKIAVPDLEVGDIIDYYYVIKNTYMEHYMKLMDPVFYQFLDQYPVVTQKLKIRVLRQIFFVSKAMNGAPELKEKVTDDETSYMLVDNHREKADASGIWTYPYRIYPTLKFQAFYVCKRYLMIYDYLNFFLKEKMTNVSNLNLANIDDLVKRIYKSEVFDIYKVSEVEGYLSKNFKKPIPNDTVVKYAYYYLRQNAGEYGANSLMLILSRILENKKIPHDLVITIPNYISDVSDLILPKELSYMLRIKGKPDYYIGEFSYLSTFKSINTDFQGNNAFAVSNPHLEMKPKVEKVVIPVDKPEGNRQISDIAVKFVENSHDSLQITLNKSLIGNGRADDIGYVVTETKYYSEVKAYLNKVKPKEKNKTPKVLKEEKLKLEQEQKDCEQAITKYFKNEFGAGEDFKIDSYSLKNIGIWDNSPELKYDVSFKAGTLVKKMGPNYLVSIGKIITSQLELSKKDLERKVDIYAPYPRMFEYNISFEIPDGYNVKGLDKLNIDITNATGGFTSKAEMQNNKLVIHVKKQYNHNFEKVAEWPKMIEFIEAAYNFTQLNILLEKK